MLHVVRFPHGAANGLLVVLLASLSVGCSLKAASKGTTLSLVLPNSSTRLSQLGGPPVHGVVPSQWNSNSFACYGVNVVGPGISDTGATPTATQFSNFSALASGATACSYRGVVSNTVSLAAAGGSTTIDLQVPAGSNRIIQLVGITDAANCGANFLNPTNAANSVAYLIGTAAADLQGDTTVNIPISYSAANPKRVDCLYGNAVTVLPVAAMTSHSSGYFNASESSGTSITGTCTEIGQTVTLTSGANTFGPYTCTAGLTWDITIDATFLATIPNGSSATFTIQTTSATGNAATPTNFTIVKDTTAPANPSAVALVGVLSPNHFTDISVQVAGVTSGDTVKLYSAASCTGTLLATATAASSSVTIAVALGADSTYDFYPKVIDPAGNSVCGSAHETYILDTVAPVVTAVSLSPYSGGSYTGSSTYFESVATISATSSESISAYCIQETGLNSCTTWTAGGTLPSTTTFDSATSRSVAIDVWVKDLAGNVSTKATSGAIDYDNSCETISGTGVFGDPYLITSATQFAECIPLVDGTAMYLKLMSDVDLSAFPLTMPALSAELDGNFHQISGLVRNSADGLATGLFRGINDGGSIFNLNITSPSVSCMYATGQSNTGCGILAGTALGVVTVKNNSIQGTSSLSTDGFASVGGLVGFANGEVHFLQNKVQGLTISSDASISTGQIGGLVGTFKKTAAGTSDADFSENLILSSQVASGHCKDDTGGMVGRVEAGAASVNIQFDQNSVGFNLPCGSTPVVRVGGMIGSIQRGAFSGLTVHVNNANVKSQMQSTFTGTGYYGGFIGYVNNIGTQSVQIVSSLFAGTTSFSDVTSTGVLLGAQSGTSVTKFHESYWSTTATNAANSYGGSFAPTLITSTGETDAALAAIATYSSMWTASGFWLFPGGGLLPKLAFVDP